MWGTLLGINKENIKKVILDPKNPYQKELEAYEVLDAFDLFPIPAKEPVYAGIIDFLTQQLGYKKDHDLFLFYYDWRKDPREASKLLTKKMKEWSEIPYVRGKKFSIIAHSLGGIVAEYAVNKEGADRWTNMVITLATPLRGSASAFQLFNEGLTKDSFGFDINGMVGENFARDFVFWNPSTYFLLTHDGVPSFYLTDKRGNPINIRDYFPFFRPDIDITVVEDIDVSSDGFMTDYITWRYGENGKCIGECQRRLNFALEQLQNAREMWSGISIKQNEIPRFRVLSAETNERETLQGLLFELFSKFPKEVLKSPEGDGTVSPEGAMTREEWERYQDYNQRYRVFINPESGVIDTFPVDSPKFLYYYKKYGKLDPPVIFPYAEFMSMIGGHGLALEERTSLKVVNSGHVTIFAKEPSFHFLTHLLENSNNHYVSVPLSDGAFFSYFVEFPTASLAFDSSFQSDDEVIRHLFDSALNSHVKFAYSGLPVFMLNWIRELTRRFEKVKLVPREMAAHSGNRAIELEVSLYLIGEEKPLFTSIVKAEANNLYAALSSAFSRALLEIDREVVERGEFGASRLPPIDYRFSFPSISQEVIASIQADFVGSFFQTHYRPSGYATWVSDDFELSQLEIHDVMIKEFQYFISKLSFEEQRKFHETFMALFGDSLVHALLIKTSLNEKDGRVFYLVELTFPNLSSADLLQNNILTNPVRMSGGQGMKTLSCLKNDHKEAIAFAWRVWLSRVLSLSGK